MFRTQGIYLDISCDSKPADYYEDIFHHDLMKARQQKILFFIKKHQFHPTKNLDQLK